LIADPGAETNLDIVEEFTHQERVAVLNCNFLKPRNEGLKFVVLNLWLRLIFRARVEQPRLPRAALEIRELKDIAPSVLGNSKYKKEVKALQSTIYEIATRGGSRRILMLGSTQKLNDVYKPVRTNMPVKILLQLGEEEIMTLDRAYNFYPEQRDQLTEFSVGQGMLMTNGEAHWPIQWRGARCGLGLGDETWRDRYAEAWGARVIKNHSQLSTWKRERADHEVHINARTGRVKPVDISNDTHPDLGEWFLLVEDLFEPVQAAIRGGDIEPPEKIDRRLVETALKARRETEVPSDLGLKRATRTTERSLSFSGAADDSEVEQMRQAILDQRNVPTVLRGWAGTSHV
jgi:hypothetical protein